MMSRRYAALFVLCVLSLPGPEESRGSPPARVQAQIGGASAQTDRVVYVGGGSPQNSTMDIGQEINAAYAALPDGGKIIILPPAAPVGGDSCYHYSTPIVFGSAGRIVTLEGVFTGSGGG